MLQFGHYSVLMIYKVLFSTLCAHFFRMTKPLCYCTIAINVVYQVYIFDDIMFLIDHDA